MDKLKNPHFRINLSFPTKRTKCLGEKWVLPGLGIFHMSLGHLVPKNRKDFKDYHSHIKKDTTANNLLLAKNGVV